MTERLVITEVGTSSGNEKTCSIPGIMDGVHQGKKCLLFAVEHDRVEIKEKNLKHTEGNITFIQNFSYL